VRGEGLLLFKRVLGFSVLIITKFYNDLIRSLTPSPHSPFIDFTAEGRTITEEGSLLTHLYKVARQVLHHKSPFAKVGRGG
jgi:hypothetical protein